MPASLGEIASAIGAELHGNSEVVISRVATIQNADDGCLAFLSNRRYASFLKKTAASAVVLSDADVSECPVPALVCADPYLGFVKAVRYLNPTPEFQNYNHPTAIIDDSVSIPEGSFIGANVIIEKDVKIDGPVYIGHGCIISEEVTIGSFSRLLSNVTICHGVHIGDRTIIHPGAVIGADGFGLAKEGEAWLKIPQLGSVTIGDDAEIGANTTIDRGAIEDTLIGNGVKIDNQVQIGHNVVIGEHTAIAGQVAVAGSVKIGHRCMIGGASAINGHIEISDDVVITGMSGVSNSIKESGIYSAGIPVTDNLTWRKNIARFKQLDKLARRLGLLESDKNNPGSK